MAISPEELFLEARTSFHREHTGHVYILGSTLGFYKIGFTNNLFKRFTNFGVKLPFEVWLEDSKIYFDCGYAEKYWHEFFRHKRINGEWFKLEEKDLDYFHHSSDDYDSDFKLNLLYANDQMVPWDRAIMGKVLENYAFFVQYKKAAIQDYYNSYESSPGVTHQYVSRKFTKKDISEDDYDEFDKPFDLNKPFTPPEPEG